MTLTAGSTANVYDVLNIFHAYVDKEVPATNGQVRIPVIINNVTGQRDVYLYLRGLKANIASELHSHSHNHGGTTGTTAPASANGANASHNHSISTDATTAGVIVNGTSVPQAVQIFIDGVEYTPTIGDPNGKGATMYDSINADWGINGTTEWDTGRLNLTSLISWTAGEHYIEIKETGGTGGRINALVSINTGY